MADTKRPLDGDTVYSKENDTTFEAVNKLENSSSDGGNGDEETARVLDKKAERSLAFKFDIRLMPVLAIMCMYLSLQLIVANDG